MPRRRLASFATLALVVAACRSHPRERSSNEAGVSTSSAGVDSGTSGAPPAAAVVLPIVDAGPLASGIPLPVASVEAELNPAHAPPYSGPTGAVAGVVHVTGDAPPARHLQIPFACA